MSDPATEELTVTLPSGDHVPLYIALVVIVVLAGILAIIGLAFRQMNVNNNHKHDQKIACINAGASWVEGNCIQ